MYLIGIKDGKVPCGNGGTLVVHYKERYKIMDIATKFKRVYKHDEVCLIRSYPQKACELTGDDLVTWVEATGERII